VESAQLSALILAVLLTAGLAASNSQSLGEMVESAYLFSANGQLVDKQEDELALATKLAPKPRTQMSDRPAAAGFNLNPINTDAAAGVPKGGDGGDSEIDYDGSKDVSDPYAADQQQVDPKRGDPEHIQSKPSVPLILQTNASNCGLASLAMLLSFYSETSVSLATLERTAAILLNATSQIWKDEGYSVRELQSLARAYGLSVRAARVGAAELPLLSFPLLAWIDFGSNGHFTVVQSVERGVASLADPTRGYLKLSETVWEQLWLKGATGIVLYVE